jgi:hypothetical protein
MESPCDEAAHAFGKRKPDRINGRHALFERTHHLDDDKGAARG